MRSRQILRREISDTTPLCAAVAFQALDRVLENTITNRKREGEIKIVLRGGALTSGQCASKVVAKGLLDFRTR